MGLSKILMRSAPEEIVSGPQSAINCGLAQPVFSRDDALGIRTPATISR